MQSPVEKILLSETRIQRRVAALAREIRRSFEQDKELTVVAVLNGSLMFAADLVRRLPMRLRLDYVKLSLYNGRRPDERGVRVERAPQLKVRGRNVLIVDDILDTGLTLAKIRALVAARRPHAIRICVLLDKKAPRRARVRADFVGFHIPNEFVVGYGLDYRERYRNLPFIGVLRRDER